MNINTSDREEFEKSARIELEQAVKKARQLRNQLRLLEDRISQKDEKIRDYQNAFSEMGEKLVKIQIKLYTGGTS